MFVFVCVYVCLFVCLSVSQFVCLFVCLLAYLLVCLCLQKEYSREITADVIFMKYMFNIVMCQGTCEPICSKRGGMPNTTKLFSLIPV